MSFPTKTDWQTTIFYRSPRQNAQSENIGILSVNLADSKYTLMEKGTGSQNVSDLQIAKKNNCLPRPILFFRKRISKARISDKPLFHLLFYKKEERTGRRLRNGGGTSSIT